MKSLVFLFLALVSVSCAQRDRSREPLSAPWTRSAEREHFRTTLVNEIEGVLASTVTAETARQWEKALWGMGLARYTSESTRSALREACAMFFRHSPELQRAILEAIYSLYPNDFVDETKSIMLETKDEKLFAMAALHYARAKGWDSIADIIETLERRFPRWNSHPILKMLNFDLHQLISDQPPYTPPIVDLLSAPIQPGKPVLFSLQRKHRRFPGMLVIRQVDGRFLRMKDATYFMIPQLALASSNLPGYITNGNTPQGIFSVQGFDVSDNQFIGPTMNVQMVMPFEANPGQFFHDNSMKDKEWDKGLYDALLPDSWRGHLPIYTSYYAGEAGRTEIIAHGTTIDPAFAEGEPYFPNAPTLGCLSASELWSPDNGSRLHSDQQLLIDMMRSNGFERGYCVVVELDDKQEPVSRTEVEQLIHEAEHQKR